MKTRTRRVADTSQIVAIHTMMTEHCQTTSAGFAFYDDEWSDERVHKEVLTAHPDWSLSIATVSRIRAENFGRLRSPRRADHETEIAVLKQKVADLEGAQGLLHKATQELRTENTALIEWVKKIAAYVQQKHGGYVPPPGKVISTPPNNPAA